MNITIGKGQFEVTICDVATVIYCSDDGQYLSGRNDGTGSAWNSYPSCTGNNSSFTGHEDVYRFTAPSAGNFTIRLYDLDFNKDLDMFVLSDNGCSSNNCFKFGAAGGNGDSETITLSLSSNQTIFIVVDGFEGDVSSYKISVVCNTNTTDYCNYTSPIICGEIKDGSTVNTSNTISDYSCFGTNKQFNGNNIAYRYQHSTIQGDPFSDFWISLQDLDQIGMDIFVIKDCDSSGDSSGGQTCIAYAENSAWLKIPNAENGAYYTIILDAVNPNLGGRFKLGISCPEKCVTDAALQCGVVRSSNNYSNGTPRIAIYGSCGVPLNSSGYSAEDYKVDFTPPETGKYTFTLSNLSADLDLFILEQCDPRTCIGSGLNLNNQSESVEVDLIAGRTYYISVDGKLTNTSNFNLLVECNNANYCDYEQEIYCGEVITDSTLDKPNSINSYGCFGISTKFNGRNISFRYRHIVQNGTRNDFWVSLHNLSNVGLDMFVIKDCNPEDDYSTSTQANLGNCIVFQKNATFMKVSNAENGAYYTIIIDAETTNVGGNFKLGISCPETCEDGPPLQCNVVRRANNFTHGSTEIAYYNCIPDNLSNNPGFAAREYKVAFTPPTTGDYTFSLTGLSADLDIFILEDCDPRSCLKEGLNGNNSNESISLSLTANHKYYVIVDGNNNNQSTFDLKVTCPETPCTDLSNTIEQCFTYIPLSTTNNNYNFSLQNNSYTQGVILNDTEWYVDDQLVGSGSYPDIAVTWAGRVKVCVKWYVDQGELGRVCYQYCKYICFDDPFSCNNFWWYPQPGNPTIYNFVAESGVEVISWELHDQAGTIELNETDDSEIQFFYPFNVNADLYVTLTYRDPITNCIKICCRRICTTPSPYDDNIWVYFNTYTTSGSSKTSTYSFQFSDPNVEIVKWKYIPTSGGTLKEFGNGVTIPNLSITESSESSNSYQICCIYKKNGCYYTKCITIYPGDPYNCFTSSPATCNGENIKINSQLGINQQVSYWTYGDNNIIPGSEDANELSIPASEYSPTRRFIYCVYRTCNDIINENEYLECTTSVCCIELPDCQLPDPYTCDLLHCESLESYSIGSGISTQSADWSIVNSGDRDAIVISGKYLDILEPVGNLNQTFVKYDLDFENVTKGSLSVDLNKKSSESGGGKFFLFDDQSNSILFGQFEADGTGTLTTDTENVAFTYTKDQFFSLQFDFDKNTGKINIWRSSSYLGTINTTKTIESVSFCGNSGGYLVDNICQYSCISSSCDDLTFSESCANIFSYQLLGDGRDYQFTFNNSSDIDLNQAITWYFDNVNQGTTDQSIWNLSQYAGRTIQCCIQYRDKQGCIRTCCVSITVPPITTTSDLHFTIGEVCGSQNQEIAIPISVENFENMIGFTFSIKIEDPSIAEFIGFSNNTSFPSNILPSVVDKSTMSFLWFPASGQPTTLTGSNEIGNIMIKLKGNSNSNTAISFGNNPVSISAEDFNGQITPMLTNGIVCVESKYSICGTILTPSGKPVSNATVMLGGSSSASTNTDNTGHYCFDELDSGDYTISASRNIDFKAGVSAGDLFRIQRHLLSIEKLSTPYKIIAADTRNPAMVSSGDLFEIQRLLLAITTSFQDRESWRFVSKTQVFPPNTESFLVNLPETIQISNLSANISNADMIGIKIGDVDDSVNPIASPEEASIKSRSGAVIDLKIESKEVKSNEEFEVALTCGAVNDAIGMSFSVSWDIAELTFLDITQLSEALGINNGNFNLEKTGDGILGMNWFPSTGQPINVSEGEILLHIKFKVKGTAFTSTKIEYQNEPVVTSIETLEGVQEVNAISSEINIKSTTGLNTLKYLYDIGIFPNPADDIISIASGTRPFNQHTSIKMVDLTGRVLHQTTLNQEDSLIQIGLSNYPSGLYYIKIENENGIYTDKIVIAR